ncbi:hypothetical protein ES703_83237 [subsurface metagenome]
MRPRKTEHEQQTLGAFKLRRVLTITELSAQLHFSVPTVRRRLKEWRALSSYNHSGRYYTLPSIPDFNKKGLWKHQGAFFSKHGTLKNTVIHLARIATGGLSNSQLEGILGVNPNSSLPQCKGLPGLKREKHGRQVVYFSADEEVRGRQKRNRFPPEPTTPKLPPDALGIIIVVGLIKNPDSSPAELGDMLRKEGYEIDSAMIENLLEHYGLSKKKLNTRS